MQKIFHLVLRYSLVRTCHETPEHFYGRFSDIEASIIPPASKESGHMRHSQSSGRLHYQKIQGNFLLKVLQPFSQKKTICVSICLRNREKFFVCSDFCLFVCLFVCFLVLFFVLFCFLFCLFFSLRKKIICLKSWVIQKIQWATQWATQRAVVSLITGLEYRRVSN